MSFKQALICGVNILSKSLIDSHQLSFHSDFDEPPVLVLCFALYLL